MRRKRENYKKSQRYFSKSATPHNRNDMRPKRGGIRL